MKRIHLALALGGAMAFSLALPETTNAQGWGVSVSWGRGYYGPGYGFSGHYYQRSPHHYGYRYGYDDGYRLGRRHAGRHYGFNYHGHQYYRQGTRGYHRRYGPVTIYQNGYRGGYAHGYRQGYYYGRGRRGHY